MAAQLVSDVFLFLVEIKKLGGRSRRRSVQKWGQVQRWSTNSSAVLFVDKYDKTLIANFFFIITSRGKVCQLASFVFTSQRFTAVLNDEETGV